jgi:hypothetical protein
MSNEIILEDSDEAAQPGIATGWVSSNGIFYADNQEGAERAARYMGCTHVKCSRCGEPVAKGAFCTLCCEGRAAERVAKMPREEWDGSFPIYDGIHDEFIEDDTELDELLSGGKAFNEWHFQKCKPNHVGNLDPYDFCCDELPEDGEVPDAVTEAAESFNAAVKGIVLSYSPVDVVLTEERAEPCTP